MGTSARNYLVGSAYQIFQNGQVLCRIRPLPRLASAAPQVPLAAAPLALPLAPNCKVEDVVIETQACTPRSETVCNTIDVTHQHVEYEQICGDVTSTHCPAAPAHLIKREADAEADPQYFAAPGYGYAGLGYAPTAVAAPVAPAVTTVKHACHEVTTQHCVDSPKAVDTVVPLEHCHVKQVVDCVPASQTVPKTVCEPVETKHVAYHPFAYHY